MHVRKNNSLNIVRDQERVDFVSELYCISQLRFLGVKNHFLRVETTHALYESSACS